LSEVLFFGRIILAYIADNSRFTTKRAEAGMLERLEARKLADFQAFYPIGFPASWPPSLPAVLSTMSYEL
jgi:ABC-type arginine transport system permease subunit